MGTKIDFNVRYKLDNYAVSDLDESSDPKYYGFLDEDGKWYIMMNSSNHFRYESGQTLVTYQTAWAARASQIYSYFSDEF